MSLEGILRKPQWIRSTVPAGENVKKIKKLLKDNKLFTVCEEAQCPNLGECWEDGTATIMILGDTCTRNCKFCDIATGNPKKNIEDSEISNAISLIEILKLKYMVITSVDRDDLDDGGSIHFYDVVNAIKQKYKNIKVEVLIPDFLGVKSSMDKIIESDPFVIAHNIETVRRLTPEVRDRRASYNLTLEVLNYYSNSSKGIPTKSSIMLGLGETNIEIEETMKDLRRVGVIILTLGQYLRPSMKHLSVEKYYTPDEFEQLKSVGLKMGFQYVAAGPLVRSSYKAADYLKYLDEVND